MNKKMGKGLKAGIISAIPIAIIWIIVAILFLANIGETIIQTPEPIVEEKRTWKKTKLPWLGEAEPGLNVSGVREIYIWANGGTYTSNLSNASGDCYAYGDVNNTHIGSNVPFNTAFDIIALVQWDYASGFNETSSEWDMDYVRAYLNQTDLSISSAIGTDYHIWNQTEQMYVHHVWDNSGAGYTISRGQNITTTYFDFEDYTL